MPKTSLRDYARTVTGPVPVTTRDLDVTALSVAKAVADYRRVFPAPLPLAPNLDLAVNALAERDELKACGIEQAKSRDRLSRDFLAAAEALAEASTKLATIEALASETRDAWAGHISTHYDGCHRIHAGCLAARILDHIDSKD